MTTSPCARRLFFNRRAIDRPIHRPETFTSTPWKARAPRGAWPLRGTGGRSPNSSASLRASALHQSPHGVRISPDGKQAWAANLKGGTVSVIDTESRRTVARINVGKGPARVGAAPDGRCAFVSLSEENRVAFGAVPIQLYATPDSRLVLVANQGTLKKPGSTMSVMDAANLETVSTIGTGAEAGATSLPLAPLCLGRNHASGTGTSPGNGPEGGRGRERVAPALRACLDAARVAGLVRGRHI